MAKKWDFGLTPWGAAFLRAMEGLGDPGRLDRGRSYAGRGKVLSLEQGSGRVKARVEGSYRPVYRVELAFPPLSGVHRNGLLGLLDAEPLLLARIRAGELPEELIRRIEAAGIPLFPRSWAELKPSCSCPDEGDPCKHEAAVIYVLAQEIDREPLALFRLLGLGDELGPARRLGSPVGGDPAPAAPSLGPRIPPSWPEEESEVLPAELPRLASYGGLLPRLIPSGPRLAGLELSTVLAEFYHYQARCWESPLLGSPPAGATGSRGDRGRKMAAEAEDRGRLRALALSESRIVLREGGCLFRLGSGPLSSPLEAVRRLLALEPSDGTSSFRFLRRFSLAMRAIVAAGAFHPCLAPGEDSFRVGWKPALFGADVASLLAWAGAEAAEEFIERDRPAKKAVGRDARSNSAGALAQEIPDRRSLLLLLAGSFLDEYVAALRFLPSGSEAARSPLAATLFSGGSTGAATPATRSLPTALGARFSVYELAGEGKGLELRVKSLASARKKAAPPRAEAEPGYALSASLAGPGGERCPLHAAGKRLGSASLAFPALLSAYLPGLIELGRRPSVELGETELGNFVVEAAPLLARLGVSVVLPKELSQLARPRAVLAEKRRSASKLRSVLDLGSLGSFEWKVAIGGEVLSAEEFSALLDRGISICRFKESYVRLEPRAAAAILERIRREGAPDALGALKAALAGEVEEGGSLALSAEELLKRFAAAEPGGEGEESLPAGLEAKLRPYQARGYRWLLGNLERGFSCLLADDMGLGKTVQTIALVLRLKEAGRLGQGALVIAPASLLTNWERELARFSPGLRVRNYYGARRRLGAEDLVITTYEIYLRDSSRLAEREWDLLVLDEAHLIKNPDSKRCKAVKRARAARRLALTGTPVENNLAELWSIFDFLLPGYLGSLEAFAREFRRPVELERSLEAAKRLRKILAPFILRRLKTDPAIAPDLPEKVVIDEFAELTAEQALLYEAAVSEGLRRIEMAEDFERRGLVLALLIALKQITNHPRNWDKESPALAESSGKSRLLLALLDAAMEAGERVIVFSQYVEMLRIAEELIVKNLGLKPLLLHGGMSQARRDEAVDRFQRGEGPGIFLVSLRAGGVGLNLTAASRVIHYDLWFNPAVESQATDRAFRIGQTKNVFVHRLVTAGTLEERINQALAGKRELAELTVGAGETWLAELGDAELRELLELRKG